MVKLLRMFMALCAAPLIAVFLTGSAFASSGPGASKERRVALVIGNDAYLAATPLERAAADARAIAAELRRQGFEVIEHINLDRRGMNRAVTELADRVEGGGVATLFFAGHGVQVGGKNFLLPVDSKVNRTEDLESEALDLERVMDRLHKAKAKFALLIIDACRDNPFPKTGGRSVGALSGGLAIPQAPQGLMVVYSAGINEQAMDRLGPSDTDPNGLFTREFLKVLREPGIPVDAMVRRARNRVSEQAKRAGHQQNPALYDQTSGEFILTPLPPPAAAQGAVSAPVPAAQASGPVSAGPAAAPVAVAALPAPGISELAAIELAMWDTVRNSTTPAELEEYLRQFPNGRFAVLARTRLAGLARPPAAPQPVAGVPLPASAPSAVPAVVASAAPAAASVPVTPSRPPEANADFSRPTTGVSAPQASAPRPLQALQANPPPGRYFGSDDQYLLEVEAQGDKLRLLRFVYLKSSPPTEFKCGAFENAVEIKLGRLSYARCNTKNNIDMPPRNLEGQWPFIDLTEYLSYAARLGMIRTPPSRLVMLPDVLRPEFEAAQRRAGALSTADFAQHGSR